MSLPEFVGLESKRVLGKMVETLCAFANASDGSLALGLRPALQEAPPPPSQSIGGVSVLNRRQAKNCVRFQSVLTAAAKDHTAQRYEPGHQVHPLPQPEVLNCERPPVATPPTTLNAAARRTTTGWFWHDDSPMQERPRRVPPTIAR